MRENAKYSALTIAILVCNILVIISGIFFAPQLAWEIPKRCILMGIVTVASIILLAVAVHKKEFKGPARNWLMISYIIDLLLVFRWVVTVYFIYT